MKKSDIKSMKSIYNHESQEKIYRNNLDKYIEELQPAMGLRSHNKLDILNNPEDFQQAFTYACGQLRDCANLYCIENAIDEEADECSETYTPEVYLSHLGTRATKKKREIFSTISSLSSKASNLLYDHLHDCEAEVIKLLWIIKNLNYIGKNTVFQSVFSGKIKEKQLKHLLDRFSSDEYDIPLSEKLIAAINPGDFSVPIEKSCEIVTDVLVQIIQECCNEDISER